MRKHLKILIIAIFTVMLLLGFAVPVNMVGNWYQQFMPNLNGRTISDIFFLDSLTGWAVTNATNQNNDTMFVLKTINGGDTWTILYRKLQTGGGFPGYYKVYFLNQNTGFVCGVTGIDKSTNGGTSWVSLNAPFNSYLDMSILNDDTIWLASSNPLTGGVFRTTNGGGSWTVSTDCKPDKIYMYNHNIGFSSRANTFLYKTVNGGNNWFVINGTNGFLDIIFSDSLTGWKCNNITGTPYFHKTTNGGLNWFSQVLPTGGIILNSGIVSLALINKDTLYGVGSEVFYGAGQFRGMIYRTINGGVNWLFQVPDTTIHIGAYNMIRFINRNTGWAYAPYGGIHTITGGDTGWLLGVRKISSEVPKQFRLYQNYPNPFNPKTVIKYQIVNNKNQKKAYVILKVFDITGKEIIMLVNEEQSAGTYTVDFSGYSCASGVYFYSLMADNKVIDTKRMVLLK